MAAAGYRPGDVDIVALTHCHPDHILGLIEDGAPAFPNARLAIGRREHDAWMSGEGIPAARAENRALVQKLLPQLADRTVFLDPGDSFVPGITAEAAFGHAPGHLVYRVESAGKALLIWGDVANHYVFSVQAPEAGVAFDDDPAAATATRMRLLAELAAAGTPVIGFHMPFPSVGYIEGTEGRYRWVPASYQVRTGEIA